MLSRVGVWLALSFVCFACVSQDSPQALLSSVTSGAEPDIGGRVYLADLQPSERRSVGFGSRKITLGGTELVRPVDGHPFDNSFSRIVYVLPDGFVYLTGKAAISDLPKKGPRGEALDGSGTALVFQISGDNRVLWKSRPLQKTGETEAFQVNVSGVKNLELRVNCPGAAYFAWAVWVDSVLSARSTERQAGEMRLWASQDKSSTVKARLLGFGPQGLNLETEDGRSINVPIGKLSTNDQQYAREAFRKSDDRPVLGFYFGHVRDLRSLFKSVKATLPAMRGGVAVVKVVRGSPAHAAGMKPFDVVTNVDGTLITDVDHMTDIMMEMEIGHACTIMLKRPTVNDEKIIWSSESLDVMTIGGAEQQKLERAEELAKAKECPLQITGGLLKDNIIGMPELSLVLENSRDSAVVAYEIEADCFNSFGDQVGALGRGSNVYRGIGQATIPGGDKKLATWQLSLHDTTTKVTARVVRVKLENGIEWNADKGDVRNVAIEMKK